MRALLLILFMCFAAGAAAQLRPIPKEAVLGQVRHLESMWIELDGTKVVQLSAGAQIRDTDNRLVLPASLTERTVVRYLVDGSGDVHRVWILSADEIARLPPPPFPK
jgi:type II secretory pathway component PulM